MRTNISLGRQLPDRQVASNADPIAMHFERLGQALDLSMATVTFDMFRSSTGEQTITAGAGSGDANGYGFYTPLAGELDTPGWFSCQMTAVLGNGNVAKTEVFAMRIVANPVPPTP